MALPTAYWKGVLVSRDMVAPLNSLAASVPNRVTPIPGYGSYRDNYASGGTDNGSGHLDIYAGDGWTSAQREQFVKNARRRGFMAFYRPKTRWSPIRKRWITETWGRHFHLILKDSADLATGARTQLRQWYAGSDGLAGFYAYGEFMFDPDPHDRTYLFQTWSEFNGGGGTLLGNDITPSEDDDMAMTPAERKALIDDIARAVHERSVRAGNDVEPLGLATGRTRAGVRRLEDRVAAIEEALAATPANTANAVHEKGVQAGNDVEPLGLAVGRTRAAVRRLEGGA